MRTLSVIVDTTFGCIKGVIAETTAVLHPAIARDYAVNYMFALGRKLQITCLDERYGALKG